MNNPLLPCRREHKAWHGHRVLRVLKREPTHATEGRNREKIAQADSRTLRTFSNKLDLCADVSTTASNQLKHKNIPKYRWFVCDEIALDGAKAIEEA